MRRLAVAVSFGAMVGASLAGGLGWLAYEWIVAHETKATGPTAASVDEGFGTAAGSGVGIALGVVAAFVIARRPRLDIAIATSVIASEAAVASLAIFGKAGVALAIVALIGALVVGCLTTGAAMIPFAYRAGKTHGSQVHQ